jgi:hypothetical protein
MWCRYMYTAASTKIAGPLLYLVKKIVFGSSFYYGFSVIPSIFYHVHTVVKKKTYFFYLGFRKYS